MRLRAESLKIGTRMVTIASCRLMRAWRTWISKMKTCITILLQKKRSIWRKTKFNRKSATKSWTSSKIRNRCQTKTNHCLQKNNKQQRSLNKTSKMLLRSRWSKLPRKCFYSLRGKKTMTLADREQSTRLNYSSKTIWYKG